MIIPSKRKTKLSPLMQKIPSKSGIRKHRFLPAISTFNLCWYNRERATGVVSARALSTFINSESNSNMRLANKASLADLLWCASIQPASQPPKVSVQYVLDGGALLHKLPWSKEAAWGKILQMYFSYVTSNYGTCIVVFDGYANSPSTKDCAHFRRCGGRMGDEVYSDFKIKLHKKKENFLSNPKNKQRLILMMGGSLERAGCIVHHARGDADLLIAKTAIATAQQYHTVVLAGDPDIFILLIHYKADTVVLAGDPDISILLIHYKADTVVLAGDPDIFILLIHYKTDSVTHDIWLQITFSTKTSKCRNIAATRESLGGAVVKYILFALAVLGCDTTSRVYGIGKQKTVSKLKADKNLRRSVAIFMSRHANVKEVVNADNSAPISLYNGGPDDMLDTMRYQRFCEKTARSIIAIDPCLLPPTSAAAKYHSLRVYHQVQVWLGHEINVPPKQWGWRVCEGRLVPVMTDKLAAPSKFLQMIFCNCKTGSGTLQYTCRKSALECTAACDDCHGACSNSSLVEDSDSDCHGGTPD